MKMKSLLTVVIPVFFLLVLGGVALAQGEEVPPPYTGIDNPFPWGDASAITAGNTIYQSNCGVCHGTDGNKITAADFSTSDFAVDLEARPDYYFWRLSEGNLSKGMPAFKSSLSDEERWQLLSYLQSLGANTATGNPFSWDDSSALTAGNTIYRNNCQGCHGTVGNSITAADFSSSDFAADLESRPDYYFSQVSDGALSKGMPPFRSSLSEEERWQVLTYVRSLGANTAAGNPFSWDDSSALTAGNAVYLNKCQGCHGTDGNSITAADFSSSDFASDLEARPDYYFTQVSDGALSKGMPAFSSSLSEEERWQVLTYIRSLANTTTPEPIQNFTLSLQIPDEADSGEPLIIQASLKDGDGNPVPRVTVKFSIGLNFFISGPLEIGEALTDNEGTAILEYIPRHTGEVEVKVSYRSAAATSTIKFPETAKIFYETHVGIHIPAIGEGSFLGPERPVLGLKGEAPKTVFRLPTGILFWLTPLLLVVIAIWSTYFFVFYQVYRIPVTSEIGETDTRRIPLIAMIIVTIIGIGLVLKLVTGPISHP